MTFFNIYQIKLNFKENKIQIYLIVICFIRSIFICAKRRLNDSSEYREGVANAVDYTDRAKLQTSDIQHTTVRLLQPYAPIKGWSLLNWIYIALRAAIK